MANATLKIENAAYIITVDSERRIIRDGSIVIDGQTVRQVGKSSELADVGADRVIDASGMVVTPGLINGHVHISYAHATRGIFPDDLDRIDYLSRVFALQSAMNQEEEYHTSLLAITELIKSGTTCFVDPGTTKFIDSCMQAWKDSGTRIIMGSQVVDQPNPVRLPVLSTEAALAQTEATIRRYDGALGGRVRAWAMPFSSDYASSELLVETKRIADECGTGLTLHQMNDDGSVAASVREHGQRPIERLEALRVLDHNTLLAHGVGFDASDVERVARTGASLAFCPTASIKIGEGVTSRSLLPEMLAKGVHVSLGTDAANNSNLVETLRSIYLAAVLFKDARRDTSMVPAETALELATIEGARALGMEDEIGSIEVNKKADLVLFDAGRVEWRTLFNPVNNLVYSADGRSVDTVIVDGQVVVAAHKPLFVDESSLIQKTQELGEGLLARTGVPVAQRWPVV